MSPWYVASSLLVFLLALVHSVLGERLILGPLLGRGNLPRIRGSESITGQTLRFAWHLTTLLLWGMAGLLLLLPAEHSTPARLIALSYASCGLVSLVGARGRHFSWYVFLIAAALVAWGSR